MAKIIIELPNEDEASKEVLNRIAGLCSLAIDTAVMNEALLDISANFYIEKDGRTEQY